MRILLVTNDFPPTIGGIQSYLRDFLATLPPEDIVVFASTQDPAAAATWDQQQPYKVYRWPRKIMLPTPATINRMQQLIRQEQIDVVWFGAAAPLGLIAGYAKQAGATRVVASTHGHEVGWSMLPIARQLLGVIGRNCDIVTYISDYTLRRFQRAFGNTTFAWLPSGVAVSRFQVLEANEKATTRTEIGWQLDRQYVVCISRLVPRKGQDELIKVWPKLVQRYPQAELVLVGAGSYEATLRNHAGANVSFAGRVSDTAMKNMLEAADVFAMPCRTRGGGLDVEGLGIVYLEAQAAGIPVIAGDSGGAPETVTSETGFVIPAKDQTALYDALTTLLGDATKRRAMGQAGRRHVEETWTWEIMGQRLRKVLGYR
jgi:hypothetical protein